MTGDPRFHELLKQIGELHDKKQKDYGSDSDPFANVRASERWGIPPWVGALVRLNDKVHRLQQFAQKGELANESAEDSMMDIAVYALMGLILYREEAESRYIGTMGGMEIFTDPSLRPDEVRVYPVGTSTDTVEHDPDIDVR